MKILCMIDRWTKLEESPLVANVKANFPEAEIVAEYWGSPEDDFTEAVRTIEVHGPGAFPVPQAFYDNADADILLGGFCPFSKAGLAVFEHLHVLGVERAGMENVDAQGAVELGILVVNATGRNADSVSDFAIAMMMAENRKIAYCYHHMMEGGFRAELSNSNSMMDMRGKTVGIVGFGFIGKLVAEKLSGFHMEILVYDPFIKPEMIRDYPVKLVDKQTLFQNSDFVTIHARYTEATRHIVGREEIAMMKPNAVLVNTARAGLVDYDALAEALKAHKIAGAALDVFEEEPLERTSPFFQLDNVTLTPHIAGATHDATLNSPRLLVERVCHALADEPTPVVTPEVLNDPRFTDWRAALKN